MMHVHWCFWEWLYPAKSIEKCPDINFNEQGNQNSSDRENRKKKINYSS